MSETTLTKGLESLLPDSLTRAQQAMNLPEVQEMVRALSRHGLGVFMPHMHDDQTGGFQVLPAEMTSVENDLQVSFVPTVDVKDEGNRTYVPVGWTWSEKVGTQAAMACAVEGTMHKSGDGIETGGIQVALACAVEGTMHKSGDGIETGGIQVALACAVEGTMHKSGDG